MALWHAYYRSCQDFLDRLGPKQFELNSRSVTTRYSQRVHLGFLSSIGNTPGGADEVAPATFTLDTGIVAALVSAAVAIFVTFLVPVFESRRQRRDAIHSKLDAAVGLLFAVQAARHYVTKIPGVMYQGSEEERADFLRQTVERGISQFIDLTDQARSALAAIAPYVPEARSWVASGWEIREDEEPAMRGVIERARSNAVRSERLFRSRQYPK
ncbi:hypothetical protein ACR5KS_11685 [Leucobacter sp. W1153]|uniref:hypothetical protein n=1 Tax=Leucobacter sp. W1153 TaxID=3439064 RepID=UPI003F3AAAA5